MKKNLKLALLAGAILAMAFCADNAHAQRSVPETVSKVKLVKADTGYVNFAIIGVSTSVEAIATKDSGVVSGKFYLQGKSGTGTWYNIDSLTLTDQAVNRKIFPLGTLIYSGYRGQFINGANGNIKPSAYSVRWSGQP